MSDLPAYPRVVDLIIAQRDAAQIEVIRLRMALRSMAQDYLESEGKVGVDPDFTVATYLGELD